MSAHLISTRATELACTTCGIAVLVAHDQGLPVKADLVEVDLLGEIAALAAGKWTYTHTAVGGLLVHRDATVIRGGALRGTIHVEHNCRRRLS